MRHGFGFEIRFEECEVLCFLSNFLRSDRCWHEIIASVIISAQKDSHLLAFIMHGQVLKLKVYLSLHLP